MVWSQSPRPSTPRNVLFISVDDLNDWIGCLGGHPQARTPNLDRLAGQGLLFTNAHCAAPLCNPSRAALMTGMRPTTTGVYDNNQPFRLSPVAKDAITLPMHLRAHGYRAIGAGKIYHGSFPDPLSWDDYWPSQIRNQPPSPVPPRLPANGVPGSGNLDWGPLPHSDEQMGDYGVATWVSSQLERKVNDPLFLACGIYRPHLPWYVPKQYFDLFPLSSIALPTVKEDDLDDVPPIARRMATRQGDHKRITDAGRWREAVQGYLASIAFADAQIGRVLRALETGPNAGNFQVILWSDHGWHLGEKLHWRKFALWEEATHNVLMMSVPGVTRPGGRCTRAVNLLDIYPTLTDTLGLPKPPVVEGDSLLPFLRNPRAPKNTPTLTTFGRGNHSLRDERWRYTRYLDGTEELYHHQSDPMEWTNLATDTKHSAVKKQLQAYLPASEARDAPVARGNGNESGGEPTAED
jgi:arylsulfatase A-like enzyme